MLFCVKMTLSTLMDGLSPANYGSAKTLYWSLKLLLANVDMRLPGQRGLRPQGVSSSLFWR